MERNQTPYFLITVLSLDNEDAMDNSYDIAYSFNDYFASITKTKKSIKYSYKVFQTILRMKVVVNYFCTLLIKTK